MSFDVELVRLTIDTSQLEAAVRANADALKRIERDVSNASASTDRLTEQTASAAGAIRLAGMAYLAWREGKQLIEDIITTTADAEVANARLESQLRATGNVIGSTADALREKSQQLAGQSLFGHKEIEDAMSVLLSFRSVGPEAFDRTMHAAIDLSSVMHQDLQSSIVQIGKALDDPIRGLVSLHRIGVDFTQSQKEQIKTLLQSNDLLGAQKVVLEELEHEFGGAAGALHDRAGLAAALHDTHEAWDRMLEKAGETPAIMRPVMGAIDAVKTLFEQLGKAVDHSQKTMVETRFNSAVWERERLERMPTWERRFAFADGDYERHLAAAKAEEQAAGDALRAFRHQEEQKDVQATIEAEAAAKALKKRLEDDKRAAAEEAAKKEAAREAKRHQEKLNQLRDQLSEELALLKHGADAQRDLRIQDQLTQDARPKATERDVTMLAREVDLAKGIAELQKAVAPWVEWSNRLATKTIDETEKYVKIHAEVTAQMYELETAAAREAAEEMAKIWDAADQQVVQGVTNAFEQLFAGQIRSFRKFAEQLLADAERLAAQLAAKLLIQNIGTLIAGAILPSSYNPAGDNLTGVSGGGWGGARSISPSTVPGPLSLPPLGPLAAASTTSGSSRLAPTVNQQFVFNVSALDGASVQAVLYQHRDFIAATAAQGIMSSRAMTNALAAAAA